MYILEWNEKISCSEYSYDSKKLCCNSSAPYLFHGLSEFNLHDSHCK